jgi:pimeloyl-ACP methyl ester carboxylesterase
MILKSRKYGEGVEVLVILHGLFGQSDNWTGIARKLGESMKVFVFDLRNHGDSPHAEEMSYELMAEDVAQTCAELALNKIHLAGHSMGGKVGMVMAQNFPQMLKSLIVIDIAPKPYKPHHQQIIKGLRALNPSEIKSRTEADEILSKYIGESGVRQFLLKNLSRAEDGVFEWKFNLNVISDKIEEVGKPTISKTSLLPTLFYTGEKSSYVHKSDHTAILSIFPNAQFIEMADAGHWLHAEKPAELITTFLNWIERNS